MRSQEKRELVGGVGRVRPVIVAHLEVGIVVHFYRAADVHGRQQREDVSLQQGYQQFQHTNEQTEGQRQRANGHRLEQENQADKAQDNDVTGRDVGEESHHERNGLDENAHNLHWYDDG